MNADGFVQNAYRAYALTHQTEIHAIGEICIKLFMAVALAGILGLERERKGRAAGLRTHVLVCLGATLAMALSELLAAEWTHSGASVWLDKGRVAAGIITGIGFLGAGTIINVGSTHRGLTTAAMLWFVATLGIVIGAGYYLAATIATVFALFTAVCLEYFANLLPSHEEFHLAIRLLDQPELVDTIEDAIRVRGFTVTASRLRINSDNKRIDATFDIISKHKPRVEQLVREIRSRFETVERIEIER